MMELDKKNFQTRSLGNEKSNSFYSSLEEFYPVMEFMLFFLFLLLFGLV